MYGKLRAVLTVVILLTVCVGTTMWASNWAIALVPFGIVVIVYLNLEPLAELAIWISRGEAKRGG